jgi:hypothetical protein
MKRRYYFEGTPSDRLVEWDLPTSGALSPYWYFGDFLAALAGNIDDAKLLQRLLYGISQVEGVPEHASRGGLALRVTETTTEEIAVVKLFPRDEFGVRRPLSGGTYSDGLADQLILEHRTGSPSLAVGLDLFEFLGRAADGFLPGSEEQRALIEDLAVFKDSLLVRPTQDVALIEGGRRTHLVRVHGGKIEREGSAT